VARKTSATEGTEAVDDGLGLGVAGLLEADVEEPDAAGCASSLHPATTRVAAAKDTMARAVRPGLVSTLHSFGSRTAMLGAAPDGATHPASHRVALTP
jgi:hypothetical protein